VLKYKTLFLIFSLREFSNHDKPMALFLCHKVIDGEVASSLAHLPSMNAYLCLTEKAISTNLFQLSKSSPLKMLEIRG